MGTLDGEAPHGLQPDYKQIDKAIAALSNMKERLVAIAK